MLVNLPKYFRILPVNDATEKMRKIEVTTAKRVFISSFHCGVAISLSGPLGRQS